VSVWVISADTESEIEPAFVTFACEGVSALFVTSSFSFVSLRHRLAALPARYRIPAMYDLREFPDSRMDKDYLILKRVSASRPSGEWNEDDYHVLADGTVRRAPLQANAAARRCVMDVDA
jgi:hypothetical protein